MTWIDDEKKLPRHVVLYAHNGVPKWLHCQHCDQEENFYKVPHWLVGQYMLGIGDMHKGCQPKEVLTPDQMTVERSIMAGLITYTYGRLTPIGAKKIGRLELANKWQMIGFDGRPGAPCPYTWGYTGSGGGWPMIEGKDFLLSPFPRQAFNQRWWEENWSDKHWMTHHTGERWNLWRYEPYFSRDSVWLDNKSKPGELGVMADFVPLRASYGGDLVDSLFDRRWANEPHLESIQLPREKCRWDTDGDGNCAFHPLGCPA